MLPQEEVNYLGEDTAPEFQMRVACQLAEGSNAARREQPFGNEARAGTVHDERSPRELASMMRAGVGRGERLPLQVNPRQVKSSKPYGGLPYAS